jgi:hypothetical protein
MFDHLPMFAERMRQSFERNARGVIMFWELAYARDNAVEF